MAPSHEEGWMRLLSSMRLLSLVCLLGLMAGTFVSRADYGLAKPSLPPNAASNTVSGNAVASSPPVPPEFASLYDLLSANLDTWQSKISSTPPSSVSLPTFGAHVLGANGNRGTALLAPTTLPFVDQSLDRLKELGIGGVTISVVFPLLNVDYPNSASYLAFYQTVAQHVRARGLALSVEQNIAFHDTPFSSISFDFSRLPFAQFESEFHAMAQLIVDNMHPDYLTLVAEPDTFASLTGYQQTLTPAGAVSMIETVATGVQRGATKIGTGSGSWLSNAATYAAAFAASSVVDYVDIHIYPTSPSMLDTAQAMADAAHGASKPIVLDEAWLYKIGPGDSSSFSQNVVIFQRDNYSFWAPLDEQFLTLVAQFARANGIAYVAPFCTTFFWAYADYGPATQNLSYAQITQLVNQSAYQAMLNDTFTPTGDAWRSAISPPPSASVRGIADRPEVGAPPSQAPSSTRTRRVLYGLGAAALVLIAVLGVGGWRARRRRT
jgi:hypothetical protein